MKGFAGKNLREDFESAHLILRAQRFLALRYLHCVEPGFSAAEVTQLEQE
jgi:hypothetical protein